MGHIVQEGGLCAVCVFCGMYCVLKFLIDLLVLGPVRQIQDVFLLTLNVATEYNYTESALLTGLLMNILSVPLTLLTGPKIRKLIQNMDRFI